MIYLCNCAECGREIVSPKSQPSNDEEAEQVNHMRYKGLALAGRLAGRPWCARCLNARPSGNCLPSKRSGILAQMCRSHSFSSPDDIPGIPIKVRG